MRDDEWWRLERAVYGQTAHGVIEPLPEYPVGTPGGADRRPGVKVWSGIAGSDARTAHYFLRYPFHLEDFKVVVEQVEESARELHHMANCLGCARDGGCAIGKARQVPRVEPHAMAAMRTGRAVIVAASREDWDEDTGDIYALAFVLPGEHGRKHRFELMGSLDELESIVEDARSVLADQRAQVEEEVEAHDDVPDDHPGFSADFLTF